jgi:hypothetical protein
MKLPVEIVNTILKYIQKESCYSTYIWGNDSYLLLNKKENIAIVTNNFEIPFYKSTNYHFEKRFYHNMKEIFVDSKIINKFINYDFK